MSRLRVNVLATLGIAAVVHVGGVWALPRLIMRQVMIGAGAGGAGRFLHQPLPTADARSVVRPCPDFAYSTCVLDLTRGPARLRVPLTPPYTSVALYSSTTDNYFARSDRDTGGRALDVVVVAPGAAPPSGLPPGAQVVVAPEARSFALVRRAVETAAAFPAVDAVRRTASCGALVPVGEAPR